MSSAIEHKQKMLADALGSTGNTDEGNTCVQNNFLSQVEISTLSSVPGALALLTANGIQIWANETAVAMLGPKSDWLDYVNPQYAVEALRAISSAASDHCSESAVIKVQGVEEDGTAQTRTLMLKCNGFQPANQNLEEAFALVSIVDVTMENELEVQLNAAKQDGEDKNRFFYSMSHELRTPLNAIIGFSELLEGKAAIQLDDAKRLEYAGLINGSANHLLGLINDILDLSRLDAGKNEAAREPIDLEEALKTISRSMMPIAMRKSVDVIVEENGSIPSLYTDRRALTQIVTNILSNAIKFSHEKGVVRVKTVRLRNRIKIVISDEGIGMDTETQSKLGGLFYQSGDVIRGKYGGSGLGMSIVYKLVELLGGKIAINSQYDAGTTVSIILPMGAGNAIPVPAASNADVVYLTGIREKPEQETPAKTLNSGVIS